MQTESTWKKEKSVLEEDASNISILKKEITKEAQIDVSVQSSINQKVQNLKHSATFLAKKLQNEKHKNAQLEMIIKYMREKMEQQRVQASNSKGNVNSEDLNSLQNRFKKLEYDLSQINGKVNRMSENLEQKKSKISQNRTQRVIDSGIFRNIEKELINSELTFKKLLIEKIKYLKEYEKITQEYSSLKEKAETYYCQKDSQRTKNSKDLVAPVETESKNVVYKKKFLQIEQTRTNQKRYTTFYKFDEQLERQQEKKIMCIKKILIKANLDNCTDLMHYFEKIEDINEKYFNEINIYADQSNQIEKYLKAASSKKQKKMRFSTDRSSLTKQQQNQINFKHKKEEIKFLNADTEQELRELINLFESEHFQTLLKSLGIEITPFVDDGHPNFDKLTQTLKLFDSNVSQYLREPIKAQEEKNQNRNSAGTQRLDDMINKVRKNDECLKVMKKEQFKDEYQKLLKNMSLKTTGNRSMNKKKSFPMLKK